MNMNQAALLPVDEDAMALNPDGSPSHLIGGRCTGCGATFFPKREICPSCFDKAEIEELPISSKGGKLLTFTIVRRGLGVRELPYAVGYVDTPEKIRIFSALVDCDPDKLEIGMEMETVFKEGDIGDGEKRIIFEFKPVG
jgi:scaffold protein (connect acetoacetyl-CoA thiolase and HMG-CoA synthase)